MKIFFTFTFTTFISTLAFAAFMGNRTDVGAQVVNPETGEICFETGKFCPAPQASTGIDLGSRTAAPRDNVRYQDQESEDNGTLSE